MSITHLFTDGSVDPKSRVGFGAFLFLDKIELELSMEALCSKIEVKRFEDTSSTQLEIETVLWALDTADCQPKRMIIYTDSQNTHSLVERRARLESSHFRSKSGKPIKHAELYRRFYQHLDTTQIELKKVKGHQRQKDKDSIARIFTLVDRAARRAQRTYTA